MGILDRLVVRDGRTQPAETSSAVARRAAMVPDHELLLWVENALAEVGKATRHAVTDDDPAWMEEAETSVSALVALFEELKRRRGY